MRYIDGLDIIDDIQTLMQFLYISKDNYIEIENIFNIKSRIKMNSDFTLEQKFINGTAIGQVRKCDQDFTISYMKDLIGYLKDQKPMQYPDNFKNRWEEIKNTTEANIALTRMNQMKFKR